MFVLSGLKTRRDRVARALRDRDVLALRASGREARAVRRHVGVRPVAVGLAAPGRVALAVVGLVRLSLWPITFGSEIP